MTFHKSIQLAGTVTVGPKGQIVIPADVREGMRIAPGDKLVALYVEEKQSICFITEDQAQKFIDKMGEQFITLQGQIQKAAHHTAEGWE